MRILFVTSGGLNDPSARVRLLQFRPALERDLGRVTIVTPTGRGLVVRVKQAATVALAWRADVVVLQRLASPTLARGLARANRRLVYDIDDAVYVGCPEIEPALPVFERVVVGNRVLADHVRRFNAAVTVIPSVVDESRFPLAGPDRPRRRPGDPFVVGWIGHPDNTAELSRLRPAFERLADRFAGRVVLRVVSSRPFDFGPGGPPVQNKPWRLAEERDDVRSFDAGIMPLADTAWNRGKCAYKALVCMSQGVPTVVSPVGVNADVIVDGANGYHATTPDEWADRLGRLAADPSSADVLAAAGRRTIAERFTTAAVLPAWAAVLRGAAPDGG